MRQEHRTILYDDIARQVAVYGKRYAPSELSAMIDSVTRADVDVRFRHCYHLYHYTDGYFLESSEGNVPQGTDRSGHGV